MSKRTEIPDEKEKVADWRLKSLLDAGLSSEDAIALAGNTSVDIHKAVKMARDGCSGDLLRQILL